MLRKLLFVAAALLWAQTALGQTEPGMPAKKDAAGLHHDYRTFHATGKIDYGKIGDSYTAELVMYLAGNQFMVMEDLIKDFQKRNPDIKTVYVETIPPGQILKGQILKQGMINSQKTAMNPDLYASVNLNHLKTLAGKKQMKEYMIYTHNKLEIMVAKGNPKNIRTVDELARDDVVLSLPNPITEGISKFYVMPMLKNRGIHQQVTADKSCKSCWAIPGKTWFTSRHHRETPYRIEQGQADAGVVWATEVVYAKSQNRGVEGVAIPAPDNMASQVGYAIGVLNAGRNQKNAQRFLDYLRTDTAQSIYAKHGFVKASGKELALKPL
ncbi:MAG: substrate-binding domain-containing protein [Gammaproteobacteria bacterium]|jgi:ABC-type molybdate transport system substrate-binding protein